MRLLEPLGRLRPLGARRRARDLVLDAALVLAAHDAEEALLAPVGVPRVGDLPVFRTVLHAPPDNLDGVTTRGLARRALVNSARIILEVAVDCEGRLDGPALHDHALNFLLARRCLSGAV